MVGDGRLLEAERVLEVADADRLSVGLGEHVHDLEPMPIGERPEEPFQLDGVLVGELRPHERRAAGEQTRRFTHTSHRIEKN